MQPRVVEANVEHRIDGGQRAPQAEGVVVDGANAQLGRVRKRDERTDDVFAHDTNDGITFGPDRNDPDDRFADRVVDELGGFKTRSALLFPPAHHRKGCCAIRRAVRRVQKRSAQPRVRSSATASANAAAGSSSSGRAATATSSGRPLGARCTSATRTRAVPRSTPSGSVPASPSAAMRSPQKRPPRADGQPDSGAAGDERTEAQRIGASGASATDHGDGVQRAQNEGASDRYNRRLEAVPEATAAPSFTSPKPMPRLR